MGLANFVEGFVPLQTSDILVFYTDGIVESRNCNGNEYGTKRLISQIQAWEKNSDGKDLQQLIEIVRQDLTDFRKDSPFDQDDTTIIAVRIL